MIIIIIFFRFHDKNGLIEVLVSPVIKELTGWFHDSHEDFHSLSKEQQKTDAYTCGEDKFIWFVNYIYDHFSIFRLILCSSEGTKYRNFIDELVKLDMKYTCEFMDMIQSNALSSGRLSKNLLHMLSNAYYSGIFETILQGFIICLRNFFKIPENLRVYPER